MYLLHKNNKIGKKQNYNYGVNYNVQLLFCEQHFNIRINKLILKKCEQIKLG